MNWVGYVAIYIVAWAVCLFMVLPWGVHNQSDDGEHIQGTERGSPVVLRLWKKLLINTVLAAVVVALIYWGASSPILQRYWH